MRAGLFLVAAFLVLFSLTRTVEAAEAVVWNRHGLPMVVEGQVVEKTPATVSVGSTACVRELVHYVTPEKRLVFRGWLGGGTEPCIKVDRPGTYEAVYAEELLVVVDSNYERFRRSFWAVRGERVLLEAQRETVEAGYRYVFERWSRGETPFNTTNTIVVLEPLYVELRFRKEVLLQVVSSGAVVNGTGWYREGEVAVISAPKEVWLSEGEKLVFREWVSIGASPVIVHNAPSPVTAVEVRAPHVIKAVYDRYFLVNATGPQGVVLAGWFREGELLQISTPDYIDIKPDSVRLAFKRWSGDLSSNTNTFNVVVKRPLNVKAVYVTEYRVDVKSPAGSSGAGWYEEGSAAVVRVPNEVQALLFVKRSFKGFSGDCGDLCSVKGPLTLRIDSPKTVEAVYVLEPDLPTIGVAGLAAAALSTAYYVSSRHRHVNAKAVPRERLGVKPEDLDDVFS